ncbi:hypothetical protein [Shewanella fidelis]|uniref:Uncharacterized protein n=1 Tax=Shewanella fidelis TaxID=173509 RepID=A0AAW8NWC2_9GAMM|nr:hypothetical protein [Shewanella fidelis]MDR8526219.1 hypothetical protein [Shewanella fidelis]MDW4814165.1 hypothetical protein [Shewanella fidelis]MDW4818309.1 hypothetical protein [Shewanella fidelis]MDW4822426.1 hypothetical protein [Shewanella fidelis]MDW4826588.1 hypothetical protein [Shewanella fidelis]
MPFNYAIKDQLLQQIQAKIDGQRVPIIEIGSLTEKQHEDINKFRIENGIPPLIDPSILYMGRHHVESRNGRDGYNAEDILTQIIYALDESSIIPKSSRQTLIRSIKPRDDGYGNKVTDTGVLELTSRKPKAELYSVIPKGDTVKPIDLKQKKAS